MKLKRLFNNLFLICLGLLFHLPCLQAEGGKTQNQPLSEIIDKIGEKYEIIITYNSKELSAIETHFEFREGEDFEDAVNRSLNKTGLKFKQLSGRYYIIYNEALTSRKKIRQLKKTVKELQKLEQGEHIGLYKSPKANTISLNVPDKMIASGALPKTITGVVTDASGEPLIGAAISEKGSGNGTITDIDGSFSLDLSSSESEVISVSFIGYVTQEVSVINLTSIEVKLISDAQELEEVVVIGYGTSRKKDITGAITIVENLKGRSVNNVEEALQGNVAGLTIQGNGGDPTSTPKVSIRGVGSLSDESPLWVVDGVPYYGAPLNPYDIETISVLKDAASTAIYGVKAAGGVILVTTKKGRTGALSVDLNIYTGIENVWKKPVALNAAEQALYYNISDDNTGKERDPIHDAALNPDGQITQTNWVDEIFQTGQVQNYNVGISGGSEAYTFATSLGYNSRKGTLLNTKADRFSLRYNSEFRFSDKLKVGENLSFTRTNGNSAFTGTQASNGETNYNGIIAQAIKAPPSLPVYNSDGGYSDMPAAGYGLTIHPVATLERITIDNPVTDLFGNLYVEYDILKGLKFRSGYGINQKSGLFKEFTPRVPEASKTTNSLNSLELVNYTQSDWSWENTLTYNTTLNDQHSITLLGGYTQQSYSFELSRVIGENFQNEDPNSQFLVNAGNYRVLKEEDGLVSDYQENKLLSYFGRVKYSYDGKYLFSASVRRDGSSKLDDERRWGIFPSASLGWNVSEEPFLKDNSKIASLKLRASWGRIGNITSLSNYPTNVPLTSTTVILGQETPVNGFALDGISNLDIAWETSEQLNFGIDAALFDYKFIINADYFIKNTFDLIVPLPITSLAGVNNFPFVNAGQVQNKGVELALTYKKLEGDFNYSFTANIASVKNELVALQSGITKILDDTQVATHFPLESAIGEPLLSFYLIESDGIFQSDAEVSESVQPNATAGDLRFVDQNNDGVINASDRVYKGNAFPDFTYGLNTSLNYKNFDLSIFFQGTRGAVAYNGFKITTVYPAQTSVARANLSAEATNTWHPGNTEGDLFRLSDNDPNDNLRASDFWLESTDYLRLKNLTLGYRFAPSDRFRNFRIYVSGQNLMTITNYSGLDPEVSNKGIDGGQYPIGRTLLFGVNIGL